MTGYKLLGETEHRIGEIYHYTLRRWGEEQANRYYHGLIDRFEAIAARRILWRPIPPELGVNGYFCRYERHLIFWRVLDDTTIGIVALLHERMSHERLRSAFAEP